MSKVPSISLLLGLFMTIVVWATHNSRTLRFLIVSHSQWVEWYLQKNGCLGNRVWFDSKAWRVMKKSHHKPDFIMLPKVRHKLEWHIFWYLNFLVGNRKNDWFPAWKNQEKIYITVWQLCQFIWINPWNEIISLQFYSNQYHSKMYYNMLSQIGQIWIDFDWFLADFG